jgi:MFS family permease
MLAGILFYRPIYNQFLQLSFTANIEVKQRLPEPGSIKKVSSLIPGTSDSLVTTSALIVYPERLQYKQLQADTLRADGTVRHGQIQTVEKKLFGAVYWKFVFLVFIQIVFVTMVYGPIAAFLVEMFPTKIRYTSMSLPYHVGNGVFGGLTPFIATLLTTIYTGDKLVGLWYPIIIAAVSLMIGALYINNKIDPNVND